MEPRTLYDITDPQDREEVAHWIKHGVYNYALAIPEEPPKADIEDLFKKAGHSQVHIDTAKWPKEAKITTETKTYHLKKVEEGIYRLVVD